MARQTRRRVQQTDHNDHSFWSFLVKETPVWTQGIKRDLQRKLDEALGGLDGVLIVVDDIVLAGCCQTMEPAQIDNQQKLTKTLKRCAEKKIILNKDKQQTSLTEIPWSQNRKG